MNNITIHGRLTKDPVMGSFGDGKFKTNFTVAVDRSFTDKDGNRMTDYFNCVAFGKQAEVIDKHFKKGNGITVTGEMQNNKYTDKDGNNRDFWQIKVDKFDFEFAKREEAPKAETPEAEEDVDFVPVEGIDDEDLPF